MSTALLPGFADPVRDQQRAFRTVMDALASPASAIAYQSHLGDAGVLGANASAIALTLLDFEVRYHLSPSLLGAEGFVTFHTGSLRTDDPRDAAFAFLDLANDALDLAAFAQGMPDYPDRSTTIVALTPSLAYGAPLICAGPGFATPRALTIAGLPANFAAQWQANAERSPLGVDLIFVSREAVTGLPRSTRITEAR